MTLPTGIRVTFLILCGLCLVLIAALPGMSARAQSGTSLAVTPSTAELILDNNTTIDLVVTAGRNVNAFDITLQYDPAILTLESWSFGNYLTNLYKMVETHTPGVFRLAVLQLATPGVSGDGTLLHLIFHGKVNGLSAVSLTSAQFSDPQGNGTLPQCESGSLRVHSDPAGLPAFSVYGTLGLQGQTHNGGIPLALGYGLNTWLGPYTSLSLDQALNNVQFTNVAADAYRVTTSMPGYLNLSADLEKIKTIDADGARLTALTLLGGNAVWRVASGDAWVPDQNIDSADRELVESQYHQAGSGLAGDLNGDSRVDILDLALVAGNYELTARQAYQDWTP